VLKCMGTTQSIFCFRDHMNSSLSSAGTGFWTNVDRNVFAHLIESCTTLKPVTLFNTV
jgi:hypothetical protein